VTKIKKNIKTFYTVHIQHL